MANDGRVFVGDGYCNSRVVEYSAEGAWRGDFALPEASGQPPLRNPHSVVLQECSHTLYVAEREASRVHRFNLGSRELEGAALVTKLFALCMRCTADRSRGAGCAQQQALAFPAEIILLLSCTFTVMPEKRWPQPGSERLCMLLLHPKEVCFAMQGRGTFQNMGQCTR